MRLERPKLSKRERLKLYDLSSKGYSQRAIARELKRAPSTISRELSRNLSMVQSIGYNDVYRLAEASALAAHERRQRASRRRRLKNDLIREFVRKDLKDKRPPWQISERLRSEYRDQSISAQAIYNWIKAEAPELRQFLVRTKVRWRFMGPPRGFRQRKPRTPKVCIDHRPSIIDSRRRFGDWEGDTIVSKQSKHCLLSLVERRSRFTIIVKLQRCSKQEVKNAIIERLSKFPPQLRKSITLDNGPENFDYEEIAKALNLKIFFCHPYASYERGSNENANGFIRRYFPKHTDFRKISPNDVDYVQRLRNSAPMKVLNKSTPDKLFYSALNRIEKLNQRTMP